MQDVVYAIRQLRRGGTSTTVALLTIAIGIAATTVMLSVVDVLMLRPLPYRDANRIVTVKLNTPEARGTDPHGSMVAGGLFRAWKAQSRMLAEFATHDIDFVSVEMNGESAQDMAIIVSANMFDFLGVRPMLGRTFVDEENLPGAAPTVIVSHAFWRRHLGSDSAAIGRTLTLSDRRYAIVGVMPAGVHVPGSNIVSDRDAAEFWLPQGAHAGGSDGNVNVLARLAPGSAVSAAQSELDRITATMVDPLGTTPEQRASRMRAAQVMSVRDELIADIEKPVLLLLGAVLCIMIIIAANVAGMQLARLTARQPEFALRTALGASSARVARLVFVETVLLAAIGGGIGIMLSVLMFPVVVSMFASEIPLDAPIGLDFRVFGMVVAVMLLLGCACGALSAMLARKGDHRLTLSQTPGAGSTSPRRTALGSAVVVNQIALTMVLLGFTGLLTRSFLQLTHASRGYETSGVVKAYVAIPRDSTLVDGRSMTLVREMLARMTTLPGVAGVAASQNSPLTTTQSGTFSVASSEPRTDSLKAQVVFVTPGYFEILGMRLIRGRFPVDADAGQAIVLDSVSASKFFGATNPLGQTLRHLSKNGSTGVVVGIVGATSEIYGRGATRHRSLDPHVFLPMYSGTAFTVMARTSDAVAFGNSVRRIVRELQPRARVSKAEELQAYIDASYSRERVLSELAIVFAMLGVLVAAGGLYALMSYSASQRTREFGIRIALGAPTADIAALTLKRGVVLAMSGIAAGLVTIAFVTRLVRTMLFEVSPIDPLTLSISATALLGVALVASYVPARRASRVEVVRALRDS